MLTGNCTFLVRMAHNREMANGEPEVQGHMRYADVQRRAPRRHPRRALGEDQPPRRLPRMPAEGPVEAVQEGHRRYPLRNIAQRRDGFQYGQ